MECFSCKHTVADDCKYLQCILCKYFYHLHCLPDIKEVDFDYLISTGSDWKCSCCVNKKYSKGDSRPATPLSQKSCFFPSQTSANNSDSDVSEAGKRSKLICIVCRKGFSHNSKRAMCVKCKEGCHFKCLTIEKDEYMKVSDSWMCARCDRHVQVLQEHSGLGSAETLLSVSGDKLSGEGGIVEILKQMKALTTIVNQNHSDLTDNMNKYSEWVEDQSNKINEVNIKVTELCREVAVIRQENINLKKQVSELSNKVNHLEQATKDKAVEINGVPFKKDEDVMDILFKISNAVGFDLDKNMVDNCYRFKMMNKSGNIVVQFVRKLDMDLFIQKRRAKRNLNSRDIGFMEGEASVIYVNYSLTAERRKLLNAARAVRREKQYTFLWVANGRILMRKDPGSNVVAINSQDDIDKLA